MSHSVLIRTVALTKRYPGVTALDRVDFDLHAGEVHVLFGENGAGKSTLISLLAGVSAPSDGEILVRGRNVRFSGVADARAAGISAVFQEFSLVPTLTVAENLFLGDEPRRGPFLDRAAMLRRARALFADLDFPIDPRRRVATLSRAEQQMVEIAKALHGEVGILILDEPTASLTDREVDHLFAVIARMKARGVGIIYISHRMQEFARIADRVTVLRDGAKIGTVAMAGTSEAELLEMMAGRAIAEVYPVIARNPGPPLLRVQGLRAWGVHGIDLEVRPGEVLGIAGLVGSGKSRGFRALMGLLPVEAGHVTLKGRDVTGRGTRALMLAGACYLPPDRKTEGLQLAFTARDNLAQGMLEGSGGRFGLLPWRRIRSRCEVTAERVELPPAYRGRPVAQLSGGNQQKTLFGRGLGRDYDLYIFDEPTVGVDMGARAAIYRLIRDLTEAGKAVVVISSDLPEVMNLAHRLLVFSHGRIAAELEGDAISEAAILAHFFDDPPPPGVPLQSEAARLPA
ncbi:sugar ABC transporter ATP-binding protein [Azospirillum thermophilum]|uniref:Sugar ABC transporter ATP-binding protein n=1 Tax=Azospirillum thermophilum TaxID=2202148 RepID=A0A2S2CY51_9PROT|nr:sugar ABC transporter ATP-binding protein [Azospirillum thermophilum]AWK89411.1 sugar ABC transporter ATP-binding protein [Azospirillum thermophilum]